jgi:hypothetical protein
MPRLTSRAIRAVGPRSRNATGFSGGGLGGP